jgi:hypothetical protein
MRSQVQVLAGPPPNPASQSAVGGKPGTLAASPGRAGAARPSPPASPSAPPPRRQAPRQPRTVVAHPSRGRQPLGRCGNLALRPTPVPTAPPAATGGRHAGLACAGGQRQARPPPAPDPARVRHRQPRRPWGDLGGVARIRAGSAADPSRSTTRPPPGTWTRSPGAGCLAASACPQTPPPAGDRTDASGGTRADTRRLDTGRVDTRGPDAGSRTSSSTKPGTTSVAARIRGSQSARSGNRRRRGLIDRALTGLRP